MISIRNKKTIAVNLEKFDSGESNIIFIVGESGSGKSAASNYLSKKYNIPIYSTDEFFWDNRELIDTDHDLYKSKRRTYENNLSTTSERCIVEGSGVCRMNKENVLYQSMIIMGRSGLIGAIYAGRRNVAKKVNTGKFFPEFWIAFKVNSTKLSKCVREFRRIVMKDNKYKVSDFKIPDQGIV